MTPERRNDRREEDPLLFGRPLSTYTKEELAQMVCDEKVKVGDLEFERSMARVECDRAERMYVKTRSSLVEISAWYTLRLAILSIFSVVSIAGLANYILPGSAPSGVNLMFAMASAVALGAFIGVSLNKPKL